MDIRKAKLAFLSQRGGAKSRGIGWELTFEQWLAWWGADLDRRGRGKDSLQMQRFADTGPYRLDNIRKGTPARNAKTMGDMRQKLKAERAKLLKESLLDAAMYMDSVEGKEEWDEDEKFYRKLGFARSSIKYA